MSHPVRVAINGASGRMGAALCALLAADRRFELLRAVVSAGSRLVGAPVFAEAADGLRYSCDWRDALPLDVVVDFSTPAGLGMALDYCLAARVALVAGTTGSDAAMAERLSAAAAHIALLRTANFSLGVAVLTHLLRHAAAALPDWDVEIVEAHHRGKRDAPSGTALALGQAVRDGRAATAEEAPYVCNRELATAPRPDGAIGFASVRGGDLVGEHTAMLIAPGERLELVHRATDRQVFARGALQAACWLSQRGPGWWSLDDMLARPRAGD
ncbi:MAG: 4-hydroxy-tetrahydrodipicolinate reductase [Rhodanobacter sp.]